jgi:hypothetical protein
MDTIAWNTCCGRTYNSCCHTSSPNYHTYAYAKRRTSSKCHYHAKCYTHCGTHP